MVQLCVSVGRFRIADGALPLALGEWNGTAFFSFFFFNSTRSMCLEWGTVMLFRAEGANAGLFVFFCGSLCWTRDGQDLQQVCRATILKPSLVSNVKKK